MVETSAGNVTELTPRRQKYEYRFRGRSANLEFDRLHLYERWRTFVDSGENVYPLHRLSPVIRVGRSVSPVAIHRVRWGLMLLLGAGTLYFSDFNAQIPLAAPLLALGSIVPLIRGSRDALPGNFVQVCDEYNNVEVSLPVVKGEADEDRRVREQFVAGLSDAVEASREEYYAE